MNIIEGNVIANESRIVIAVSRVNRFINNNLLKGALDTLKRIGCVSNNITVVWVPGAYELPLITKVLAMLYKYDAIIVLGTIIRGATSHFEYISTECSAGLSKISIDYMIPVGFGILITDDINQAVERSGIKMNNKGSEAALSVLEMINVLKILRK